MGARRRQATSRLSPKAQDVLDRLDLDGHPDRDALLIRTRGLGEKRRTRILHAALLEHLEDEARRPFEAELLKLQRDLQRTGRKVVLVFEGRDGAGKGGLVHRITRCLDDAHHRVVALGRPTPQQQTEPYLARYVEQFPRPGEFVLFDRSWYNRAMVEPVMGFCTPHEYEAFMSSVAAFEDELVADGATTLIKAYFSVSRAVQAKRLAVRETDAWRLSAVDRQAQARWEAYTEKKAEMLRRTHTPSNPWWVIRSDHRDPARLETMKLLLRQTPYEQQSPSLDFAADPAVLVPGDVEYRRMKGMAVDGG